MAQAVAGMGRMKMLATVQMLKMDENLGGAALVALGALFLLLSFKFYPLVIIPLLALLCGFASYRAPPIGTILAMFLAFPAIAYQSPVLAWLFCLALALTLFEAFEHWSTISFLQVAILAPFAPFPFSIVSGFLFLLLGIAAMRFGSSHSFFVSIPAIFAVLLLSTLWMVQTSSFITISNDYRSLYGPELIQLQNNAKEAVPLQELASSASSAVVSIFSFDALRAVPDAFSKLMSNAVTLIARDSALVQLAAWAIALYLCALLPAKFEHRYKQTISSFALFIIPISNMLTSSAFYNPFEPASFIYCAVSVGAIFILENNGISLSRERFVNRRRNQKGFGKFGLEELPEAGVESLAEIGGYEDVKAELRDAIITPIKKPEVAYTYGIKPPNGVLLFGPPGTGKTMLMRALANELGIGFEYVKCSNLLSEWYGESEKNLSEVFSIARKNAPYMLFFDEIDAIGKRRDAYTSDDVAPRVMSVLLQEMDGFKPNPKKHVIVIGATNIPDQLDPALMRPGRFDKIIYMHLPDEAAREQIFRVHLRGLMEKHALSEGIDYSKLASITERFSGADIKNICTEASRLAAGEAMKSGAIVGITEKHLTEIIKKIKPSVSLEHLESYEKFRMDYERRSGKEEKKPDEEGIRWSDVAGLEDVRQVLLEAIELPLLHEDLMKEMQVKPSKGLLLFGPPGCGKTMIVKAAANELNANFLTISGSELMKGRHTSPSAYVKEVFNRARESAPALIFMDEIEALAPNREEFRGGILADLLQELDGVKELKNVMLVGATNKPSALDSAILRPGRFDKIIYIPPPDEDGRKRLFELNLEKFQKGVNSIALARATDGFSGADIAAACQEVKMQAVRERLKGKSTSITTESVAKVLSSRRPSITQKDLREYFAFMQEYGERK